MRTREIREMIKNRYRQISEEQTRDYYLTHDYYNGRVLRSPYQLASTTEMDPAEEIAKRDHAYLTELLSPKPTLGNALSEALQGFASNDEIIMRDVIEPDLKPAEDLLQRIVLWYQRYQHEGISALLKAETARLTTANIQALQAAYPNDPVIVQNICIFATFWLHSPLSFQANTGKSMLEHVFVHYDAPVFLSKCWKESATPENVQWLLLYFAYTQGTSLKTLVSYFDWSTESPKLWHYLPQSKGHLSPKEAVLYQEVIRLGGSESFYAMLMKEKAYQLDLLTSNEQNRSFWYSVVRWFVRHDGELVGTEITRVLTWARHQYTEFLRERKTFTMNGRSLSKVIRAANAYHRAVLAREAEIARRAEARRLAAIARAQAQAQEVREREAQRRQHVIEYYYDDEDYTWNEHGWNWQQSFQRNYLWTFRELTSSAELIEEAAFMDHCVDSYGYACHMEESAIFSLRLNGKRCVTIEIEPKSGDLMQAFGEFNRDPDSAERSIIKRWHRDIVQRKARPRR